MFKSLWNSFVNLPATDRVRPPICNETPTVGIDVLRRHLAIAETRIHDQRIYISRLLREREELTALLQLVYFNQPVPTQLRRTLNETIFGGPKEKQV